MSENCNDPTEEDLTLHALLRRRRQELKLTQAEVAGALHVSPVAITLWESGSRRMDLAKLPRIAAVLRLDPKELCAKALTEFYPGIFAVLFDAAEPQAVHPEAA
jgi:transcriptional regulator with XRE-family HTH domain